MPRKGLIEPYTVMNREAPGMWLITTEGTYQAKIFAPPAWLPECEIKPFDSECGDLRNWIVLYA